MKYAKFIGNNSLLTATNIKLGLFVFLALMYSCNSKNQDTQQQDPSAQSTGSLETESALPDGFMEFYKQFHQDSLFQISHIDFPLKGLPQNADPEDPEYDDFYYTQDQWELHLQFDLAQFTRSFVNMADIVIEERITEKKYGLMIIRRFSKGSDGWRLIYYAALNKYKVPE